MYLVPKDNWDTEQTHRWSQLPLVVKSSGRVIILEVSTVVEFKISFPNCFDKQRRPLVRTLKYEYVCNALPTIHLLKVDLK